MTLKHLTSYVNATFRQMLYSVFFLQNCSWSSRLPCTTRKIAKLATTKNVFGFMLIWIFFSSFFFNRLKSNGFKVGFRYSSGMVNTVQGILAFRDFTIRDPRYFVIRLEAKFHDFVEKSKKEFFSENCFLWFFFLFWIFFLFLILIYSFFVHIKWLPLLNIKIFLLDMTISKNSTSM